MRQQGGEVGRTVEVEQRRLAQPHQQVDHLVLRRRLVVERLQRIPDLLHAQPAVEAPGHRIRAAVQPDASAGDVVGQNEPGFPAQRLPPQPHMRRKARLERRDAVPVIAVDSHVSGSVRLTSHDARTGWLRRCGTCTAPGRRGIVPSGCCATLVSPEPGSARLSSFTSLCTTPTLPDRAALRPFDPDHERCLAAGSGWVAQ